MTRPPLRCTPTADAVTAYLFLLRFRPDVLGHDNRASRRPAPTTANQESTMKSKKPPPKKTTKKPPPMRGY